MINSPSSSLDSFSTLVLTLKDGDVRITLRSDLAPLHVERITKLAESGQYDDVVFHRVIDQFMAQTGDVQYGNFTKGYDPFSVGTGGSDEPDLKAEFSSTEKFLRGTVGMARAQNPDSANAQFFIMFDAAPFLNGQYTIVGFVESGMEFVDKIKRGDDANNGSVMDPDRIIKARIEKK